MGWLSYPIFLVSFSFAAGCYLAAYVAWVYLLLGLLAPYVLSLWIRSREVKQMLFICTLTASLAAGYFWLYDHYHQSMLTGRVDAGISLKGSGVIDSAVKRDGDTVRFFLLLEEVGAQPLSRTERIVAVVKLKAESQVEQIASWTKGARVEAKLELVRPDGARNPHAFDYKQYLRWQGVYWVGKTTFDEIKVTEERGSIAAFFERWQRAEAERLGRMFHDEAVAGYMKSLLLGITEGVEPEIADVYANLGLVHVLAISGLHITIVAGFFVWGLGQIGLERGKALLIAIFLIVFYVGLVGASPSAVRSGLMGGIGLLAQYRRKRMEILEIWGVSLIVLLLFNPYQLWQIGFQLSYIVTLGLILYVPLVMQIGWPKAEWMRSALSVTFVAQIISFPFLIYWFHQFSPLSWLVNLLLVPILSFVVLPLGYVALVVSHLHMALTYFPVMLSEWCLAVLHAGLEPVDQLRVPFSHWAHPDWWWLVVYAVWLLLVFLFWQKGYHRRRDMLVYLGLFCLLIVLARQPFTGRDEVRITFLDVGQGDSAVVEIGNQRVYVIDSGGTISFGNKATWQEKRDPYEVGKDVLLPYLRSRGIERIDALVMTHGDTDHVGGFKAILPSFSVGSVFINGEQPEANEQAVLDVLRKRHVPILTGKPGASWSDLPRVRWTWLYPDKQTKRDKESSGNNASVVLLLEAYGIRVLFTGDLEKAGENRLLQSPLLPPINLLKVGHHGSQTSTSEAFLRRIRPQQAMISLGRNNRYGHPSPVVMQRLQSHGIRTYRTDEHGAITVIISPTGVKTEAMIPTGDNYQKQTRSSPRLNK